MSEVIKTRKVKLGEVGVDSGQLILTDPSYIEGMFKMSKDLPNKYSDHAHSIYQHKDGTRWQFCYGQPSSYPEVTPFPGNYEQIIEEYGKTPNDLIKSGDFKKLDLDPTPHIPEGEYSYRGICKARDNNNHGGQLNYLLGHAGVAVAFSTGFGDGTYDVFAEIVTFDDGDERVAKVWVEFIDFTDL